MDWELICLFFLAFILIYAGVPWFGSDAVEKTQEEWEDEQRERGNINDEEWDKIQRKREILK